MMSWEKLLTPNSYGAEEYAIVAVIFFIVFVAIKHLIFHTLYHWWYGEGRLYLPEKFWNIVTGKSLPQRITQHIKNRFNKEHSIESILKEIEVYCQEKEFGLTVGKEKGIIIGRLVSERKPEKILVLGSLCGYAVFRILKHSPETAHIFVIEPDVDRSSAAKQLCSLAGCDKQVTVLNSNSSSLIPKLKTEYGVEKLDFVFLSSSALTKPYYLEVVKLLEVQDLLYTKDKEQEGPVTVILADKVVHFGENEFLKYVRNSDDYETQYHQMPLEYSPPDIVDGMEKAVYIGIGK